MSNFEHRITENSTEFEKAFLKIYDGNLWTALEKFKDWQPPREHAIDTDKLSVEKLQEQLNTAKMALISIKWRTERDELETYYVERNHDIHKAAIDALVAIGGCDE